MSDIESEDMEDQGPSLGVRQRTECYSIIVSRGLSWHD